MGEELLSTITLSDRQKAVLAWIKEGCPEGIYPTDSYGHRGTARSLQGSGLVSIRGRGASWRAVITERGKVWPKGVEADRMKIERQREVKRIGDERRRVEALAKRKERAIRNTIKTEPSSRSTRRSASRPRRTASKTSDVARPESPIISPAEARRRGHRPRGDNLTGGSVDPWDEKIMITVKEAAWMLSLPEGAIREAVSNGDVLRVFIGNGKKNYRVVYGSLLAWVDSMPRERDSYRAWWR